MAGNRTSVGPWPFGPVGTIVGDWADTLSGLRCLALVGPMGSLNGYVGVPEGHRFHGFDYSGCTLDRHCGQPYCSHSLDGIVEVHGGLTYAGWLEGTAPEGTVGTWWFGFDTAHAWDFVPAARSNPDRGAVLRSPEYVGAECSKLAHQLRAVADGR